MKYLVLALAAYGQSGCIDLGGTCTNQCSPSTSNVVQGLCPGDASITCCVPLKCQFPVAGGVLAGNCLSAAQCKGTKASGRCAGTADVQCCSNGSVQPDLNAGVSVTNLTPHGDRLLVQSFQWRKLQLQRPFISSYPQKAQCANNLSKVMVSMAGFSSQYSNPLVKDFVNAVKSGLSPQQLPNNYVETQPSSSKATLVAQFSKIYGGYLPIGTVVAGCVNSDCTGQSGDGHISHLCYLSDTQVDSQGRLTKANYHLCHNNWLRKDVDPARKLPDSLGTVGQYMINQDLYNAGTIERQWMNTPWLQLTWSSGQLTGITPLMPEIDDLDPFLVNMFIAVPSEIASELKPTDRTFRK
ncbi:hypothetical protein HDV04_000485 [Boothiomyces sp. JEL0838]|nr:hypothetical protein HDV04_000485 [Boothiomyces sp. JEL0838]